MGINVVPFGVCAVLVMSSVRHKCFSVRTLHVLCHDTFYTLPQPVLPIVSLSTHYYTHCNRFRNQRFESVKENIIRNAKFALSHRFFFLSEFHCQHTVKFQAVFDSYYAGSHTLLRQRAICRIATRKNTRRQEGPVFCLFDCFLVWALA